MHMHFRENCREIRAGSKYSHSKIFAVPKYLIGKTSEASLTSVSKLLPSSEKQAPLKTSNKLISSNTLLRVNITLEINTQVIQLLVSQIIK